jgi:hypothetical protein
MTQFLDHALRAFAALACFTIVPSCGGRAGDGGIVEGSAGATAVSSTIAASGSGSAESLSSGGESDQGAMGGSSPSGTCVIEEPDLGPMASCNDLDRLAVRDPVLTSPNGRVMPGDTVVLSVTLADMSGLGNFDYPGVLFQSSDADVTFVDDGRDSFLYALPSCQTTVAAAKLQIGSSIAPGTVVHVTALAAVLNRDCPNAPHLVIPIPLG